MTEKTTAKQNTELVYAGFIKRGAAFFLDYLFIMIFSFICLLFTLKKISEKSDIPEDWYIYFLSALIIIFPLYYFIFEIVFGQASLGKRFFALRVVSFEGGKLSVKQKYFRLFFALVFSLSAQLPNFLFFITIKINPYDSFITKCNFFIYLIALASLISYLYLLLAPKKQTWHDKITKTAVIEYKKRFSVFAWIVFVIWLLPILLYPIFSILLKIFWETLF